MCVESFHLLISLLPYWIVARMINRFDCKVISKIKRQDEDYEERIQGLFTHAPALADFFLSKMTTRKKRRRFYEACLAKLYHVLFFY